MSGLSYTARFAFHKLLVATLRPAAFQSKAEKDVVQACEVLEVLISERPGDLSLAWEDLRTRGSRWEKAAKRGLVLAHALRPEVHKRVLALLDTNGSRRRKRRADR